MVNRLSAVERYRLAVVSLAQAAESFQVDTVRKRPSRSVDQRSDEHSRMQGAKQARPGGVDAGGGRVFRVGSWRAVGAADAIYLGVPTGGHERFVILGTGEDCGFVNRSRSPACQQPLLVHQSILVADEVLSTIEYGIWRTSHTSGGWVVTSHYGDPGCVKTGIRNKFRWAKKVPFLPRGCRISSLPIAFLPLARARFAG